MSRKHNTQHPDRGRSNYPQRLAKRGLSKAPTLPDLDHLRRVQLAREGRELPPWVTYKALAQETEAAA